MQLCNIYDLYFVGDSRKRSSIELFKLYLLRLNNIAKLKDQIYIDKQVLFYSHSIWETFRIAFRPPRDIWFNITYHKIICQPYQMGHRPHPKLGWIWMDKNMVLPYSSFKITVENRYERIWMYTKFQIQCGAVITWYNFMVLHTVFQSQQQNNSQTFSLQNILSPHRRTMECL